MAGKPLFQVQVKGEDVAPENVRASELAVLLKHLDGAITETARFQQISAAFDPEAVVVSLVGVEHGESSDLTLAVQESISPAVTVMTELIAARRFSALPVGAQKHLHELSKHAIRNSWDYEFVAVSGIAVSRAVISHESPVPAPSEMEVKGQTTLWGHLIRVGGRKPKATLRLRNQELLSFDVTEAMARALGKLVYTDIGLHGEATWRADDWEIIGFSVLAIADYRPGEAPLSQTFKDLADASRGRWGGIDPVEYVKKMRYED